MHECVDMYLVYSQEFSMVGMKCYTLQIATNNQLAHKTYTPNSTGSHYHLPPVLHALAASSSSSFLLARRLLTKLFNAPKHRVKLSSSKAQKR